MKSLTSRPGIREQPGSILFKKSASTLRLTPAAFQGPQLGTNDGLRLVGGLVSVSAWPAFGPCSARRAQSLNRCRTAPPAQTAATR